MSLTEVQAQEPPVYEVPERHTVAVDFDGVIHSYLSGWQGAAVIPDPPVPGAIEFLNELIQHYELVIFTTRAGHEGASAAIMAYLLEHGFTGEYVEITNEKGPAIFYLDDRAWRFKGRWPTMNQIRRAYPWKVGDPIDPWQKKRESKRMEIHRLETALGKRKAENRQMRAAIEAVLDYFPDDQTMPPPVEALKAWVK